MATISAKAKKATESVAKAAKPEFQVQSLGELEEIAKKSAKNSIGSSMTDEQFAQEEEVRRVADALAEATKEQERLQRAAQATAEAQSRSSRGIAKYKQIVADIREAEEAQKNVTKEWQEVGNAIDMDISKTFEFKSAIMDIFDAVSNKFPLAPSHEDLVSMEMAKMDAEEIANNVGRIGKEAKISMSPLEKLSNRFKSFLQYRAMRGIWSAFIQGAKEGVKNLEDWDRKIGHTGFAESMDRARDSLLAIKNSLAVVSAPLLEWLIGILSKVAQWAVTAANAISRFFAILGGKSTYRAVHYAEGIAAAERDAGGAAKSANKEFKKQLMAFDEINNLTAQNDNGSGGGKGSGYSSGSLAQMFSEEDVGEISDTEKKLKAIWDWLSKIVEKTKEWFKETKPISTILGSMDDWYTSWIDTIVKVRQNWSEFVEGFKTARANGADFFEAVQAGLDNIGKHEAPEQLHKKWDEFVNSADAGFASLEITSKYKSDLMANNVTGSFNKINKGGENSFKGVRKSIDDWMIKPLDDAVKKESENQTGIQKIAEFARKWLLPANINDPLTNPLKDSKSWADKVKEALKNLEGTYDVTINTTENVTRNVNEIKSTYGLSGDRYFEFKAQGGLVSSGQAFIARESGPELVGRIGSHTAVANNDQIVAAVSQGVAQAVASVMGGGSNVTVTLEGDAKGIFKVVQKEGRAYSARTGQPALA